MLTAIYGVFDAGTCLYVGQSKSLESRKRHHRIRFGRQCCVRVFRWVHHQHKDRIERQIIAALRRRGQATKNIQYAIGSGDAILRVRVTKEFHDTVFQSADDFGIKASELIRHAVNEYIEKRKSA